MRSLALLLLALSTAIPAAGLFLLGTPSRHRSVSQMVLKSGRWIREERRDPARPDTTIVSGHHEGSLAISSAAVFALAGAIALLAVAGFAATRDVWGIVLALAAAAANFLSAASVASSAGFFDLRELGLWIAWGGYLCAGAIACAIAAWRSPADRSRLLYAVIPGAALLAWIVRAFAR